MRTITLSIAAAFLAGLIAVAATPAAAEGECGWGHKTKTAESSTSNIAESPAPQTPRPDPGS